MRFLAIVLALLVCETGLADRIIHKEKSLYRNIMVRETADRRCLLFTVKRQQRNQTCIDLRNPDSIVFPYVRMTFAGLLAVPAPKRLLMIGLGGGTISNVLGDVYPGLSMDLVEVDRAVVEVARTYFNFRESERMAVHVIDGRVFIRRAALRGERYDLVILDAFTGEYIPEHLMTREFLEDVRNLLTEDGAVIANTFSNSRLYDHESATYAAVFGDFLNLKMPGTGNRVIVATSGDLPDTGTLMRRAQALGPLFEPYGVDLRNFPGKMDSKPDWNTGARILTDQYAPANLLKEQ